MPVTTRFALLLVLAAVTGCGGNTEVSGSPPAGSGGGGAATGDAGPPDGGERPSCKSTQPLCAGRSCCALGHVPGGTFNRYNDAKYPATVSPFDLDIFEVTVARMRPFVETVEAGWRPAVGSGASPYAPGSGWKTAWTDLARFEIFREELAPTFDNPRPLNKYTTWTDKPGPNEAMPVSWVYWLFAQAFCIWDSGRLPTIAEWRFAASGGSEQRAAPWGDDPATPERAVLNWTHNDGHQMPGFYTNVGSAPKGAGRWGHMDLEGGRSEWIFDGAPTGSETWEWPPPSCHATTARGCLSATFRWL